LKRQGCVNVICDVNNRSANIVLVHLKREHILIALALAFDSVANGTAKGSSIEKQGPDRWRRCSRHHCCRFHCLGVLLFYDHVGLAAASSIAGC